MSSANVSAVTGPRRNVTEIYPPRTRAPLPSELLHKILINVFATSIHDISLSSANPQWDMNILYSLSSTCFTFREIMGDILGKVFAITVPSTPDGTISGSGFDSELFRVAQAKIIYLRALGAQSRDPALATSPPGLSGQTKCSLIHAYALYLKASALRINISQTSTGEVYMRARQTIIDALTAGRRVSDAVKPRELATMVRAAIDKEVSLVELETSLIKRRMDLEDSLDNFLRVLRGATPPTPEEDRERHLNEIKTDIHAAFQVIEDVSIYEPRKDTCRDTAEVRHALKLSGVMHSVKKCKHLKIETDKYDLKEWAGILVKRWG